MEFSAINSRLTVSLVSVEFIEVVVAVCGRSKTATILNRNDVLGKVASDGGLVRRLRINIVEPFVEPMKLA